MTRHIQVTLQLTLVVAPETSRDELKQECNHRLRYAFENSLSESPDSIQWIAIHDPELKMLTQKPHLDPVLTNLGVAAVVWCVDDVLEVRPDLTAEQAAAVLNSIIALHGADSFIGWDSLDHFAGLLYGEASDADE